MSPPTSGVGSSGASAVAAVVAVNELLGRPAPLDVLLECAMAAETVACGDGENDRELLDWAGFGVAVANAHDEILARADLVVPDVEHEGVALLLDAYLDSRS